MLASGDDRRQSKPVQYKYAVNPQLDISTAELEKLKAHLILIDTRSMLEWFKGKIPGAVHIQWTEFYTDKDRRPIPPEELKKLLKEHGVDINKPVVYYCTVGIRSGYAWMVHQLSGLPSSRNYEGGYEAWKRLSSK